MENLAGAPEIDEEFLQRSFEGLVEREATLAGKNASERKKEQQRLVRRPIRLDPENVDPLDPVEEFVAHVPFGRPVSGWDTDTLSS